MKGHGKLVGLMMLLAMLTLTACGGGEDSDNGGKNGGKGGDASNGSGAATYASPDEAFAAFKSAASKNDMKGVYECMTVDSQNQLVMAGVMFAAFLPLQHMDNEEKAEAVGKEVNDILEKHGLTEEMTPEQQGGDSADIAKYLSPVKDKGALVGELFALIQKEDPDSNMFEQMADAELKDLKIDGDMASGKFNIGDQEEEIEFVKVDGSWLIKMPDPDPSAGDEGDLPDFDSEDDNPFDDDEGAGDGGGQ